MLAGNSSTCTRQNGDDERVGCQSGKQGWRQIARTDLVHKTLRPHRAHFRFITHLPLLLWCTGSVRNISSWTGTIDLANRGARRPIGLRLLEPCSGDLIDRSPWDRTIGNPVVQGLATTLHAGSSGARILSPERLGFMYQRVFRLHHRVFPFR